MDGKRTDAAASAHDRGETRDEVLDRSLNEILQEIRGVLTGVQILFAFLLTLAFTGLFDDLGPFGTSVYTLTLLSTASATVLLIAPVSYHRTVFRLRRKEELVAYADRSLLLGLGLLVLEHLQLRAAGPRRRPGPRSGNRRLLLRRHGRRRHLVCAAVACAAPGRAFVSRSGTAGVPSASGGSACPSPSSAA